MPLTMGRVMGRMKSCLPLPPRNSHELATTLSSSHTVESSGRSSLGWVEPAAGSLSGTADSEVTTITVGAVLEATVSLGGGLCPPGQSALLEPAINSPGVWYQCTVVAKDNRTSMVRVRFEELSGMSRGPAKDWEAEVNKALLRYRRYPNAMLPTEGGAWAAELLAGTLVEVQMPDRCRADGEPQRWTWWPGSVQVYSRRPNPPGKVTVALNLSSDCTEQQISVPRSRLRVVLPPGARLRVEGAGVPGVDGVYAAVGFHDGAPRFECNNMTILRYGMPSGSRFWYIADKNDLEVDDGDYYRIRSPLELPPTTSTANGRWRCAKDGVEPIPKISWIFPAEQQPSPHMQCPRCAERFQLAAPSTSVAASEDTNLCVSDAASDGMVDSATSSAPPSENEEPSADSCSHHHASDKAPVIELAQPEPLEMQPKTCAICLEGPAECALIPCGHLCLCEDCAYSLRDVSPSCPMCRKPSTFTQRIYM